MRSSRPPGNHERIPEGIPSERSRRIASPLARNKSGQNVAKESAVADNACCNIGQTLDWIKWRGGIIQRCRV